MSKYIDDLYKAFNEVDFEFYSTEAIQKPESFFDNSISKDKFIQQTELQFSAELYSEWRQIIKKDNEYKNLKIGFEVSKKFIDNPFIKDQITFRPDLILHQSQINFDPNFQKIFVEVKTNSSLKVKRISHDVKKIIFAIKQYNFQNGVFISVNCREKRLHKLILNLKTEIESIQKNEDFDQTIWERIYLFYGNSSNEVKCKKTFQEIFNNAINQ